MTDAAAQMAAPYRAPSELTIAEIEQCTAAGLTSHEAAEALGVRRNGLLRQCARLGIRWPYDPADRAPKVVWCCGRWWSFAQIAREIGVARERIKRRYDRGDRGERLFRPVRRYGDDAWVVGLSIAEWRTVTEFASTSGVSWAARVFDVPAAAVQAAMRGEWERLG